MATAANEDTSTHISEFPAELLHHIFTFHTELPISDPARFDKAVHSSHLVITGVCRRWRSVAIGYGKLWTIIQLPQNNASWVTELIRRSKGYPLCVTLRSRSSRLSQAQQDTVALAFEQLDMIQEIDLKLNNRLSGSILSQLSRPAPRLRRLSISRAVFPPEVFLFNKHAPDLEELNLAECFWFWEGQTPFIRSIHKLTRLTLIYVHRSVLLPQFVDIFRSMPLLKHLEIHGSLPETFPAGLPEFEPSSSTSMVRLNSLASLQIRTSIGACAAFLASILLGPETDVNIEAWSSDSDIQVYILPFCRRFGKDEDGRQVAYIQDLTAIVGQAMSGFIIRTVMRSEERGHTGGGLTLRVSYDPAASMWHLALPTLFHALLHSLPTQQLRRLTTTYLPLTEIQWTDALSRLENLETIMFSGIYCAEQQTEFITALSKWDLSLKLKAVTLYQVPSRGEFDTLCQYFKGRREQGFTLRSLWYVVPPDVKEQEWCASWYPVLGLDYCPPATSVVNRHHG